MGNFTSYADEKYAAVAINFQLSVADPNDIVTEMLGLIDQVKTRFEELVHVTIAMAFGRTGFDEFREIPTSHSIVGSNFYKDWYLDDCYGNLKIRDIDIYNFPMDDVSSDFHMVVFIRHNETEREKVLEKLEYAIIVATTLVSGELNPGCKMDIVNSKFTRKEFNDLVDMHEKFPDWHETDAIMQRITDRLS